jgi:flagellar biosynthesis/type III secretory pathway protein FliH
MEEKDQGKVQLKTILKGNAAQAIRPAAMSGFKMADFQINPSVRETAEDRLRNEVAALQGQVATLNGEISNLKKKSEQDSKAGYDKGFKEGKDLGTADGEKVAMERFNVTLKSLQDSIETTFESVALQQKEFFAKKQLKIQT